MKLVIDRKMIIEKLKKQNFVPFNVIGIMENMESNVYYDEATITVWCNHEYFNYISGSTEVIASHIESLEDGFYGFAAVEDHLAKSVYTKHLLHWYEPTDRFVHVTDKILDSDWRLGAPYEIVPVPLTEAKGIDERYEYKDEGSFERICDAIAHRPSSAIYIEGELASYVLVHEDNSIGFMYTLEKYRHMGLGCWVTLDLLDQMRKRAAVSFVEINQANFKSQGLARKSGFEKDVFTPWFGIIKGVPSFFETWEPLEGRSYIFTTTAHLREVDRLTTDIEVPKVNKTGDDFKIIIDEKGRKAQINLTLDETKEAYITEIHSKENMDYLEVVKAIAIHFPEKSASVVLPYDEKLAKQIGCIAILKQ